MDQSVEESGGEEVARRCGVHGVHRQPGHVGALLASLAHGASPAHLHDGHLRHRGELPQRHLGVVLSAEGDSLLLVGKDDVHVVLHQMLHEVVVRPDDVPRCQVVAHPHPRFLGCTHHLLDEVVVLHQITFHVQDGVVADEVRVGLELDLGRHAQVRGEGALAVLRDEGRGHARVALVAHPQPGVDASLAGARGEERAHRVGSHRAHEPHRVAQQGHGVDGVGGTSARGNLVRKGAHGSCQFLVSRTVHMSHASLGKLKPI